MAELRRNRRGEIGRQHVKPHSCCHFSPCIDHTLPIQTDDCTSQIDHDIGAYVPYSFRTMSRVLLRPHIQLKYKGEGDKAKGLTSPPNDTIIWTEKGVSQLGWSHQFFKDLGWWSSRGVLNSRPPAQQTGALQTAELTRRRPCLPFLHGYFLFSTGRNGKLRLVFNCRTGKNHLRILRKSWRLLRHKNTRHLPYHRLKNKRLYL